MFNSEKLSFLNSADPVSKNTFFKMMGFDKSLISASAFSGTGFNSIINSWGSSIEPLFLTQNFQNKKDIFLLIHLMRNPFQLAV